MNGQCSYSIDKDIVEVVVKELLIANETKLDGNIAMLVFKAVKDDSGEVLSYTVAVKKVQFNLTMCFILLLLASALARFKNSFAVILRISTWL